MVYKVVNPEGQSLLVLVCEHASNKVPPEYNKLGLGDDIFSQHVAYDIGAAGVAMGLAAALNAPAVLANFSRLLIDPNRREDQPNLIPEQSDGIHIPGNQNISPKERNRRIKQYHQSFHAGVEDVIDNYQRDDQHPVVLSIHSFTPKMNGVARPWPVALLWNEDERASEGLIEGLEAQGHHVGLNEPYSGKELFHTMNLHGGERGLSHALIEIRQDLICHQQGIDQWVQNLIPVIKSLFERQDIFVPLK